MQTVEAMRLVGAPGFSPGGEESDVTTSHSVEHWSRVTAHYDARCRCAECISVNADAVHADEGRDHPSG